MKIIISGLAPIETASFFLLLQQGKDIVNSGTEDTFENELLCS